MHECVCCAVQGLTSSGGLEALHTAVAILGGVNMRWGDDTQCAEQEMRHIFLLPACQIGQHCSSITVLLSTRQSIFRPNTGYLVCVAYRSLIVDTPFPREFFEIALEFAQFPGMAGLGYPLPWNS